MLSISSHVRVFLARDPVDMRKSFHGLTALTESVLKQDPLSGHLFVFINRRRDRIKLLYWGGTGFCIWYQQLEKGSFQLPDVVTADGQEGIEITASQLSYFKEVIAKEDETGETQMAIASEPPRLINSCYAGPSLLALIATNRFSDHVPYYRDEDILSRLGFRIHRSTQCRWMQSVAVTPLVDLKYLHDVFKRLPSATSEETTTPTQFLLTLNLRRWHLHDQ
jgi:transposase